MNFDQYITILREEARTYQLPHVMLKKILPYLEADFGEEPRVPMESCLMQAFNIPLYTLRDIETWNGFNSQGSTTDSDIDTLLEPWIVKYREVDEDISSSNNIGSAMLE